MRAVKILFMHNLSMLHFENLIKTQTLSINIIININFVYKSVQILFRDDKILFQNLIYKMFGE